jgi:putative acetyltransferase
MSEQAAREPIVIVAHAAQYLDAFARLNLEWLERYSLLEDADRKYLEHPQETILTPGGEIFFALLGDEVVGTCALIVQEPGTIELAKLAVARGMRGRGIGRQLSETALEWARARGARKVVLVSSTSLAAALRLYERLGFKHGPMPADTVYATADVYMELVTTISA